VYSATLPEDTVVAPAVNLDASHESSKSDGLMVAQVDERIFSYKLTAQERYVEFMIQHPNCICVLA